MRSYALLEEMPLLPAAQRVGKNDTGTNYDPAVVSHPFICLAEIDIRSKKSVLFIKQYNFDKPINNLKEKKKAYNHM